jgi:hypothetical protein
MAKRPESAELAKWFGAFCEKWEEPVALADLCDGFPTRWERRRDAILQPPEPQITPSTEIVSLTAKHGQEPEAAD